MRVCPACGTENPEKARFCLECGTALVDAAPPPLPPGEERKVITAVFVDLVEGAGEGGDHKKSLPNYRLTDRNRKAPFLSS